MELSSAKEECMAASLEACEELWLRKILLGLFRREIESTMIHCENHSCIKLYKNPVFHDRSKHIEIMYHFIWECVQRGSVRLDYIHINEKMADIFTKALSRQKFEKFRDQMGLRQNPFLAKREC
jgi:hypothetical protein